MKNIFTPLVILLMSSYFMSCSPEDLDDIDRPATKLEINNFIYGAMNVWYLYKPDVPELADSFFNSKSARNAYLDEFDSPEDYFYNGATTSYDRFSFITNDFRDLENSFQGVTLQNGMEYGLTYYPNDRINVLGYVRLVLPGTSANTEGVTRGMLFNTIDGVQITADNGSLSAASTELLSQTTYTIGLAELDEDNNVVPTGESITLTKTEYTENPVYITKTFDIEGKKVGYIMYNGFISAFDIELNNAFAELKAQGVSELVLDLRYNGGGSVQSAIDLSAMITGQYADQIFSTEVWNPTIQAILQDNDPASLINRFGTKIRSGENINSLSLNRVSVITTSNTASASELVINGLDPYIQVRQVGDTTTGKFQASTTFYDSKAPNYRRDDANPNHFYAIQPLIFTTANADGVTGYINGLYPDVPLEERLRNLGTLGELDEPLLEAAINDLFGRSRLPDLGPHLKVIGESSMNDPAYQRMYVDLDEHNQKNKK